MASSPSGSYKLSTVSLAVFIFTLSILSFKLDGLADSSSAVVERKMMILGSRPPQCVNKCSGCKPCTASLVIPPHQGEAKRAGNTLMASSPSSSLKSKQDDGDSYYLLSWKCRCGNKIYQP